MILLLTAKAISECQDEPAHSYSRQTFRYSHTVQMVVKCLIQDFGTEFYIIF